VKYAAACLNETAYGPDDLIGQKGAYTIGRSLVNYQNRVADICCPDCGEHTYLLSPPNYTLQGSDTVLTCKEPITPICCGTTWILTNGQWETL
jgi:hypothetical protein